MNDLFETQAYQLARNTDPSTSHEAAEKLNATRLEALVLSYIKIFDIKGAISEQIEDLMWVNERVKASSVTPRYRKLLDKGLIKIDGKRKARSGRSQQVMTAVRYALPKV
jgi:hypothetical protein